MLTIPRALWRNEGRISSAKGVSHIEVLVFGDELAGDPVCTMNEGRERWKGDES